MRIPSQQMGTKTLGPSRGVLCWRHWQVDQESEQTFLQGRHTLGWWAHDKLFNSMTQRRINRSSCTVATLRPSRRTQSSYPATTLLCHHIPVANRDVTIWNGKSIGVQSCNCSRWLLVAAVSLVLGFIYTASLTISTLHIWENLVPGGW